MTGLTIVNEPFDSGGLLSTTLVTPLPGSNAHDTGYPRIDTASGTCNGCSGTVWRDYVRREIEIMGFVIQTAYTTTFTYGPGAFLGFGAIWDTGPDSEGGGLTITVNLSDLTSEQITPNLTGVDGWFGWISDIPIASFTISRPSGTQEHFQMDNLVFGAASSEVPEPATFVLLGTALLGLGLWRRRRS